MASHVVSAVFGSLEAKPLVTCGIFGFAAYLTLVRLLRYRLIHRKLDDYFATHTLRKGGDGTSPSDYSMTPAEAQEILRISAASDMPFLVEKALEFALFKTYGIESISKILLATGQLSKEANASRRYVDTALLISTWVHVPITGPGSGREKTDWVDPRGAIAVARTNWLHSKYKISNDDYIYTLSLFILEPGIWTKRYGWRELLPIERQAYFVFWSEIARRMKIENVPETLKELESWCEDYERAHMLPSPINREVATYTTNLLLHHVPEFAKSFGRHAVASLCPDRLRESIMQPRPPAWISWIADFALSIHRFYTGHLCLPRSKDVRYVPFQDHDFTETGICPVGVSACPFTGKNGEPRVIYRLHPAYAQNDPWYRPTPSLIEKLKFQVLATMGLFNPKAIPGPPFSPQGFRTEELGPNKYHQSGREAVLANAEVIHGGPLTGPWAFTAEANYE